MRDLGGRVGWAVALLLLTVGCAVPANSGADDEGTPDLLASLQANTYADSVVFVLQVTNTTDAPIELEFPSGQSFDFVVSEGEREIWRWSADQMFTQALREEVLGAGETETYRAAWTPPPSLSGSFTVVGTLTASDRQVRQAAEFRIP